MPAFWAVFGAYLVALGVVALVRFVAAQFYALAALLAELGGIPRRVALLGAGSVVVLYTWRGGNWAIHWSDGFQLAWLYVGIVLAAAAGLQAAGGLEALERPPAVRGHEIPGPRWFHPASGRPVSGWEPFALGDTVLAWVIMTTTWHFAMQSTAQRLLAARDAAVARRACLLSAVAVVPLAGLVALAGMATRVLAPELGRTEGVEQVAALPVLVRSALDPWLAGVVVAALVAVLMSTCDSALLGASTLIVKDLGVGRRPFRLRRGARPRAGAAPGEEIRRSRRWVLGMGAWPWRGPSGPRASSAPWSWWPRCTGWRSSAPCSPASTGAG